MSRLLRPLLAVLGLALLTTVSLASPASAHDCPDGETWGDDGCQTTTTTADPDDTTTTTEPEETTTTTEPEGDGEGGGGGAEETTTTAAPTTTTTWARDGDGDGRRRRHREWTPTTTAAPQTVASAASAPRRTTTTGVTTSAPTTVVTAAPLTYDPIEHPTTTQAPLDRSDLETALASNRDATRSNSILGISDTVLALVLGAIAVALLGTGGIRRWMERS